jgi:hypothetical protein
MKCPGCGKELTEVGCPHCGTLIDCVQSKLLSAVCKKMVAGGTQGHTTKKKGKKGKPYGLAARPVFDHGRDNTDIITYLSIQFRRLETFRIMPREPDNKRELRDIIKCWQDQLRRILAQIV